MHAFCLYKCLNTISCFKHQVRTYKCHTETDKVGQEKATQMKKNSVLSLAKRLYNQWNKAKHEFHNRKMDNMNKQFIKTHTHKQKAKK